MRSKPDPRALVSRDFARVAALKTETWLEAARRGGPARGLAVAGELWAEARALHPEGPIRATARATWPITFACSRPLAASRPAIADVYGAVGRATKRLYAVKRGRPTRQ